MPKKTSAEFTPPAGSPIKASVVRRRRWVRPLAWTGGVLALLVLVFYLGGGWYFANVLQNDALDGEQRRAELLAPDLDLTVVAAHGDTLSLRLPDDPEDLLTEGVWGLEWTDGYGQLGRIVRSDEDVVVREFQKLSGSDPAAGTAARLDVRAYRGNPASALGLEFTEVAYRGELGEYPAWFVEGTRDTWAILVHGNGMTREDALRALPVLQREGFPTLAIGFRNDPGAPEDPSGMLRYGLTEWADLEAAAQYALDEGAEDLVLVGHSMGGGIVAKFLYESPLADEVAAVIMDAPMLDFSRTVDANAAREELPLFGLGVPQSVTNVAKWLASVRFDVDWGAMNYLSRVDELTAPVLLFHGTADTDVPIATSDEFAEARPDIVTYHRVDGASHMASWNVDPERYESLVAEFLTGALPAP